MADEVSFSERLWGKRKQLVKSLLQRKFDTLFSCHFRVAQGKAITYLAGSSNMELGHTLDFQGEPENQYDPYAILVYNKDQPNGGNSPMGHLPRYLSSAVQPLLSNDNFVVEGMVTFLSDGTSARNFFKVPYVIEGSINIWGQAGTLPVQFEEQAFLDALAEGDAARLKARPGRGSATGTKRKRKEEEPWVDNDPDFLRRPVEGVSCNSPPPLID
jgi:hypothetical protein